MPTGTRWCGPRAGKKYDERLQQKVKEILEEIEQVNAAEDENYGDEDLDEPGGKGEIDAEKLEKKIQELNETSEAKTGRQKADQGREDADEGSACPGKRKYEEQERKLAWTEQLFQDR